MRRPPTGFLAVVGMLAGGLLLAAATQPGAAGTSGRPPTRSPVTRAVLVCPDVRTGAGVTTAVSAGSADPAELVIGLSALSPDPPRLPPLLTEGGVVGTSTATAGGSLAVAATASGTGSGAAAVEQLSRSPAGLRRGLAATRCEPIAADSWFVGGSTGVGAEAELVLANPYDDRALVDVALWTPAGPRRAPAAQGIVVAPRSRVVVALAQLAPDAAALAVRVTSRQGRVSPALADTRSAGRLALGVDWVPRSPGPARQVDVAGLPAGSGPRLLYLAAPGEDDAVVRVQATVADGQFVPQGLDELVVPAGEVRVVDITGVVGAGPAHLRVSSDTAPVLAVAYLEQRSPATGLREISYAGATAPLTSAALVTQAPADEFSDTVLTLAAPDGNSQVSLRPVRQAGQPPSSAAPQVVEVPQGRMVSISIRSVFPPGAAPRAVAVLPQPGSPPVWGSSTITEARLGGSLVTSLSLRSLSTEGVPVPEVVADAGLPVAGRTGSGPAR